MSELQSKRLDFVSHKAQQERAILHVQADPEDVTTAAPEPFPPSQHVVDLFQGSHNIQSFPQVNAWLQACRTSPL